MIVREPVVAGQFYPANGEACTAEIVELLRQASTAPNVRDQLGDIATSRSRPVAGLVPHAGWVFSGAVTAEVFNVLAASSQPSSIILFGGVHRYRGNHAAVFSSGRWDTSLGPVDVDYRLAERILGHTNLIVDDPYAHEDEHSLEVQVPFIRHLFPEAKIVPIMVPPTDTADEVGEAVGRTLTAYKYDALIIGTTDLTHYGPRYGFIPEGVGTHGNDWAKHENDRRFIDLLCSMRVRQLVPEATTHKNACSSGAAAATVAAAKALGATRGVLLEHTTSSEVLADRGTEEQTDSVGYAGVVFV